MRNNLLAVILVATTLSACGSVEPPAAIMPVPTQQQVEWQKMGTYAFIHFGLNTFNDQEWGYGDVSPQTFNPKCLDVEQWAATLKGAGMKGVILTAKHHDGFCLWPSAETDYSVAASPYKNGQGNIVGELAEACKKHGLKFGVYLSPWDRHRSDYGGPSYLDYYKAQLTDLLTNYGDLFEIWFDGANGGDGWYGGAKEERKIDRRHYYDFPLLFSLVDSLQPNIIKFSDGGPGCRWVGNENGIAGETNWAFLRAAEVYPGYDKADELTIGHADGDSWMAAECDVSIRPGWFYHAAEDDKVKTADELTDLYYKSVGHNATLLLNFPVDRDGLINPIDSAAAVAFHEKISAELSTNLLAGIVPEVSSSRGGEYTAEAISDGSWDTFWATPDSETTATIEFKLPAATTIDRLLLQEYIPLGQRVKAFKVEYFSENQWKEINCGEQTTTIGYKRLLRFNAVKAERLRISITDARGPLCINNIEAFYSQSE